METEPLAEACELAFEVAKRGVETNPPVDPPAPMRSFLYVAQYPPRAITVAQRVMEEDPAFRARVAAQATEARVGRAGFLWLHRPTGWEASFSALTSGQTPGATSTPVPAPRAASDAERPPPPPPPHLPVAAPAPTQRPTPTSAIAGSGRTEVDDSSVESRPMTPQPMPKPTGSNASIESELASLRELVDRLAEERQHVGSSVASLETEVVERRAESSALVHQVEANSEDLREARADREAALSARDQAVSARANAERQLEALRVELEGARSQLQQLQNREGEQQSSLASVQTEIYALHERVNQVEDERAAIQGQMTATLEERDQAREQLSAARIERDDLADRVRVAEQARVDLEGELGDVSSKWQDLQVELTNLSDQRAAVESELAQLNRVRASSQVEHRDLFTDLASQLGRVEAERDLLASQLDLANARLRGTRAAVETAATSINAEIDGADVAFGDATRASNELADSLREASRRLEALEQEMESGSDEPEASLVSPIEPEARDLPIPEPVAADPVTVGVTGDEGEATESLGQVMDSHGFDAHDQETSPEASVDAAITDSAALTDSAAVQSLPPMPPPPRPDELSDGVAPQAVPDGSSDGNRVVREPTDDRQHTERQQISPLQGDPVTVARHVVSAEGVVLLVDGDAVASLGWPGLGTAERRDALVRYLSDLAADTAAASDIVFDGAIGGVEELPRSSAVRVRLTEHGVRPSDTLAPVIDQYPLAWPIAVVSDEPALIADARQKGASILDNGQLLDLFIAPK